MKMSTEFPVATRHRRDMTEKLLKASLNYNTNTHHERRGLGKPHVTYIVTQGPTNVWFSI